MELGESPTPIELPRQSRRVLPFVSDYLPDDRFMSYENRVSYYSRLREDLGVHTVRTEFRMKDLIEIDGVINEDVANAYGQSLRAIRESGMSDPFIYLFSPSRDMVALSKKSPEAFGALFEKYGRLCARIKTEIYN